MSVDSLPTTDRPPPEGTDSYPRQSARTQRFTLGEPRDVVVSPDGRRIVFLRSRGGTDPVNCLWVVDAATGEERLVADPEVLGRDDEALPPEERARRERVRESAGGITAFATDAAVTVTSFAIGGRLFVGGLISGTARELPVAGPVFDPRPDPLARRVAYVNGRLLCIGELDGRWRLLAGGEPDEPETVTWGSADFIAAEEMDRYRGYWWSPDGTALAVTRVDTAPVQRWHLGDPADPAAAPRDLPYPAAGTANADVSLHVIGLDGSVVDVEWDRDAFPYLADVNWSDAGLLMTVQSRDQRLLAAPPDRSGVGGDRAPRRRPRRRVGGPRPRRASHRCGWVARHVRRPRRRQAPAGRWRAGHAARPAGPRGGHGRRARHRVHRQQHRRRRRRSRSGGGRPTARWRRSPMSPACTPWPPAAAPSWCARPRSPSPVGSGRRSTASSSRPMPRRPRCGPTSR